VRRKLGDAKKNQVPAPRRERYCRNDDSRIRLSYYASANSASTNEATTAARLLIRLASALLFQFAISIAIASAQSPAGTVEDFGLFGIWADDCRSGPSPSNQYASFSVTSRGIIQLHNDFGPEYGDMLYRIVDAKRIGQFRISLRQLLTTDDQVALDIIMLKSNDRIRVWSSRGADGSEYVQDGLIPAANNRETRWMERCGTRSAGNLFLAGNKGSEDAKRYQHNSSGLRIEASRVQGRDLSPA
jgi:hypothetical protein